MRAAQATLFSDLPPDATPLGEREAVRYLPLAAKTVLNLCDTCHMPNAVTLNPYRGCEFGCAYCYARYTHQFMDLPWNEFERRIYVKTNAPQVLLRTLDAQKLRGKRVIIGSATDPYQPAEAKFRVTRRLLEVFAQVRGLSISVTTKSALVKRDLDLFRRISEHNDFRVSVSLISLNRRLLRALEPKASTPEARLGAIEAIAGAGVRAGLLIMPVIPGLTDSARMLESVIRAAAARGAAYVHARALFLRDSARRSYFAFLRRESPRLFRRAARIYDRRVYTSDECQRRLFAQVAELKRRYGFDDVQSEFEPCRVVEPSRSLFEARSGSRRADRRAGERCELPRG
jgi:DNA repair photolyase